MKLISQLRDISESTIHWKRAFRFSEEEVLTAGHSHLSCDLVSQFVIFITSIATFI